MDLGLMLAVKSASNYATVTELMHEQLLLSKTKSFEVKCMI